MCVEGFRRMLASPCAAYCPGISLMGRINEMFSRVRASPATHHIGARYLCNQVQTGYDDNEFTGYLGRVGAFIRNMQPDSTLAKSPHMSKESVSNCGDYSSEWNAIPVMQAWL